MNSEMQTTLLNTYHQLHSVEEIAGPAPEITVGYYQILKNG